MMPKTSVKRNRPRLGRPPLPAELHRVRISISLPRMMTDAVIELAEDRGMSISRLIEKLLSRELAKSCK
jgi:predicted DNA-binding ribbon-helix-helix protein